MAALGTNMDQETEGAVLPCPTLRELLEPRLSPFVVNNKGYHGAGFVSDDDRVDLQAVHFASSKSAGRRSQGKLRELAMSRKHRNLELEVFPSTAIRSGPREKIYLNPATIQVAIVTCGGLCPGLNDVLRGIVLKLFDYGVPEGNIMGVRNGFKGFYDKKRRPVKLTRDMIDGIQLEGGTMLGTSREQANIREIVKRLDLWKIDVLFVIGGPGSHSAALEIQKACQESRVPCSIIAIPKSIDNDILLLDKTFGFETAVEEAQKPLMAAKVEATSGYRGIGLVKLMGRRSGFIAVQASLASGLVDICLIPEVPFRLDSVLSYLEAVVERQGHAVICVAEGAAEGLLDEAPGVNTYRNSLDGHSEDDDSEGVDIGSWLKAKIKSSLSDVDIKYIDPSYLIRSVSCASTDRIYCRMLAHGAVHGAFAGYTGITVGLVNTHFVYLPIESVIETTRRVEADGELWNRLKSSIAQPSFEEPPPPEGFFQTSRMMKR